MPNQQPPVLTVEKGTPAVVRAAGAWQVHGLAHAGALKRIEAALASVAGNESIAWDLSQLSALDHIGAQWFWNAWGRKRPAQLLLEQRHAEIFRRVEQGSTLALPQPEGRRWFSADAVGRASRNIIEHVTGFVALIGQLTLDLAAFAMRPQYIISTSSDPPGLE